MFAALLFGLFAPARFTANMQILIDPNDLRVVENVLRGQNQLTETHITQVENQVRVLLSNNVARRVVERLHLDRDPDFTGSGFSIFDPRATVRALFGARSAAEHDPALEALNALKKRIRSKRVDRTYVVDASVWADSPHRSVEIANALLDSFMEEQSAGRAEAARRVSTSLNARLAELRERVQQAEQRVEDYKKAHNLLSSSGTLVNERQLTEINSQLVLARTRTAEARARYEKIMEAQRGRADPGAIGEAVGSATITALRTQLGEIARREGEINATLGARHPAVIEIASQASRIRRMIEEEVTRIAEAARNDMERAQANEASLAASLERLKTELEGTNDAGVRLRELDRDVGASRSVYEAYLVRTREVSEQERLDTTNIRVIATPDLPETPQLPAAHADPARGRRHAGRSARCRARVLRRVARAPLGHAGVRDAGACAWLGGCPGAVCAAARRCACCEIGRGGVTRCDVACCRATRCRVTGRITVVTPPREPSPPLAPVAEPARAVRAGRGSRNARSRRASRRSGYLARLVAAAAPTPSA